MEMTERGALPARGPKTRKTKQGQEVTVRLGRANPLAPRKFRTGKLYQPNGKRECARRAG